MDIQLVRHATLIIRYAGKRLLIDPMFSPARTLSPVENAGNARWNPLVELPFAVENLLDADAIFVTHTHRDHFDDAAASLLPKDVPMFCQTADVKKLEQAGFTQVQAVDEQITWNGIKIDRTRGRHGFGDLGKKMGPVSGFVLRRRGEPTTYIVGDSVWCREVQQALKEFRPAVTVVFAGAAQFLTGEPITMDGGDILSLCRQAPWTEVIVAHMEAWNHCLLTRESLREFLAENQLSEWVHVPENGDSLSFGREYHPPERIVLPRS